MENSVISLELESVNSQAIDNGRQRENLLDAEIGTVFDAKSRGFQIENPLKLPKFAGD